MADDLTLIAGGRSIAGWESVRVTRGIERMPSDFEVSMTERFPGELDFVVQPGDTCQVLLGEDLVINGYVDRYIPSIDGNSHSISIQGRGRCADLVDCAAEWPGYQISGADALDVANKLCQPYGIIAQFQYSGGLIVPRQFGGTLVTWYSQFTPQELAILNKTLSVIPQFNLNPGETAFSVIEKICRFAALLCYEDTGGNLILSCIGSGNAASGFVQGVNVQSARITYSQDQRYSEYQCIMQSMATLGDVGGQSIIPGKAVDDGVKRPRKKVMIAETSSTGIDPNYRAQWEMVRRWGRSYQLNLVTDSWRDSAGNLYAPNTFADLSLPLLKCDKENWLISEVAYKLDESSGTTCELTIMPPAAFLLTRELLQPVFRDVPANPGLAAK